MPGIKELKNRIKSISSTRKITKAMQMVSAAKMRKAQTAVLSSRTYASLAWELIQNLTPKSQTAEIDEFDDMWKEEPEVKDEFNEPSALDQAVNEAWDKAEDVVKEAASKTNSYVNKILRRKKKSVSEIPLLKTYPNAKKVGVILLSTNRGLVGSLNSNLMPKLRDVSSADNSEVISEIVVYGKKAKTIANRLGKNIAADFQKADRTITTEDIYPIAKYITDSYQSGEYQKIVIVYNHFMSTLVQKATVKQLLPFTTESTQQKVNNRQDTEYIFEPTPSEVLEHLLPRIIESQLYQTILESDASEHSARMVMMKNATEAAGDLIADFTLTYNQLRQNKITTELAEITAGRIALE